MASLSDERRGDGPARARIAYFSMEVALENDIPTYSGGLGVLAGDTLRSAADLGLPMVGVTLLSRKGYFVQRLDSEGRQREEPVVWPVADLLQPADATCAVELEGRTVTVRSWRYAVRGAGGVSVPVVLLDTDVPVNSPGDRRLTDELYGGDDRYRLCQEVILGIGGVRMLRALGYHRVARFHMNEGHSALLALELFEEDLARASADRDAALERTKARCVFTTHTPVPAGHDRFSLELAGAVLGPARMKALHALGCCDAELNMTHVGLTLSHYVNGVSKRHGEVSHSMFPNYPIGSITNGVHSATWTSPSFAALYDRHIPDWRRDSFALRYAIKIPLEAVRQAHREAKERLVAAVNALTSAGLDEDAFTLGFARRATAYKRPDLLFREPERLRGLARQHGRLQLVFAGKAHPRDEDGKALIQRVIRWGKDLAPEVTTVYLPDYDLAMGLLLTAGVDVWLNTPRPPHEASGTSGMKAAHNGVPSLSVLDGWWLEGFVEGLTGWAIRAEAGSRAEPSDAEDASDLYRHLEKSILPLHRERGDGWPRLMRSTIAFNASFFNTQRMLQQYVAMAYAD
jgi:starch phosphorylase